MIRCTLLFWTVSVFSQAARAETYQIPLQIDYGLIKNALLHQLFTGKSQTAELWRDHQGCSFLKLSDPRIDGQNGQIRLQNRIQARMGSHAAGQCITLMDWNGEMQSWQKPMIDSSGKVLSFPVTKANAMDRQGRQLNIGQFQELITHFVTPKLDNLKVDLQESRSDIERNLAYYLPKENEAEINKILDTLVFSGVSVNSDTIAVKLAFSAPAQLTTQQNQRPFDPEEHMQWKAAWKPWDEFLAKTVEKASTDTESQELRDDLMAILLESRRAFDSALTDHNGQNGDPIREFFISTWERLAPKLKTLAKQLPEIQGLRYLTFIAATDVIYQLESIGSPLGLDISSEGFRRLGRMLISGRQERLTPPADSATITR